MGFKDFDVFWEVVVQRGYESLQRVFSRGEEVDHLALCMSPGIGSACPSDSDWLACKQSQCLFQLSLNCRMPDLQLKSSVASPLIFNEKGRPFEITTNSIFWFAF